MKYKIIICLLIVLTMNSCYTTKDLISEAKSTDGIRFNALNNFYVQGVCTVAKVNIKEKKLREKIFELGYELTDVNYAQNPYNEKYISSFSFYKKDKKKELNIKLCEDAIRDAHRGMPSPNLSRKNINLAISLSSECRANALILENKGVINNFWVVVRCVLKKNGCINFFLFIT